MHDLTSIDGSRHPTLRVHVLGTFRVECDGKVVDERAWRRRKARHLLAMLALAPHHALHRDHVLDTLWPDADPAAATNSLHQTLHLVRRALDDAAPGAGQALRLRDEVLSLAGDSPPWVDALWFEDAVAEARRVDDLHVWQVAIDLYGGDLLPQDRYEDWVAPRREALRASWLTLLWDAACRHRERGDVAAAIATLRRLLAADPVHEEAHREIMRLLAASGQRRAALRQFDALARSLQRELDAEPEPETRALRQAIADGQLVASPPPVAAAHAPTTAPATNLRPHPTRFIGREREMAEVHRLLAATRLLTLTGPGGSGKTRLAMEAAGSLPARFPDGIWLVDVSALTDPALVPREVATTLDIADVPDRPLLEIIGRALAQRRLLLLLDNCEHLMDACAGLASALLAAAPDVRLLLTSREPLRVPGEIVLQVPSLTLPDPHPEAPAGEVFAAEAARLFVDRAQAAHPAMTIEPADAPTIAQICHRLDGIPLAIELAAARARVLSLAQIAQRLDDRFRLLTTGSRTAPTRQQTLKGAIDWSHDLLDAAERRLFREISVFAGGFDLDAVEGIHDGDRMDVLDVLARLVDKSLVLADTAGVRTRYRMLESLRQYAAVRLAESGDEAAVHDRHAALFRRLAEAAEPELRGVRQREWLTRLAAEHDNMRAALDWLRTSGRIDEELGLAGALAWFWHIGGHPSEGRARLASVLERSGGASSPVQARAQLGAGVITVMQGELAQGAAWLREAAASPDPHIAAAARTWLVWPTLFREGPAAAEPRAREALAEARAGEDRWSLGLALLAAAFVESEARQTDAARAHFAEASAIFQPLGDSWGITTALTEGARVAYKQEDPAARDLAVRAVDTSRALDDRWQTVQALGLLVEIERLAGELDAAWTHGAEAVVLAMEIGQTANAAWAHRDLGHVALARGDADAALAQFRAGYDIFRERGYQLGMACCLIGLAVWEAARDPAAAATMLGASERLREETGTSLAPADRQSADRLAAMLRERLGEAVFAHALDVGRTAAPDAVLPLTMPGSS